MLKDTSYRSNAQSMVLIREKDKEESSMTSRSYTIDLRKISKLRINTKTLGQQIAYVRERILSAGRDKRGWTVESTKIDQVYDVTHADLSVIHECKLTIKCTPRIARKSYDTEFANIVEIVRNVIKISKWTIDKIDGDEPTQQDLVEADPLLASQYIQVRLPPTWRDVFSHLYDRDAQIGIIHDAIEIAIESDWKHRFHVLLFGPTGCGKSDICINIREMVGPESVLEFDATATTSAGAIRDLNDREELPRILLVEEIEKADENSLRWLLGLLDIRGNIRKLTYRGRTQRDKMMSGALASRFFHQLYCPRPDRALLEKILQREVSGVDGNEGWITPTLNYLDKHGITDP